MDAITWPQALVIAIAIVVVGSVVLALIRRWW